MGRPNLMLVKTVTSIFGMKFPRMINLIPPPEKLISINYDQIKAALQFGASKLH
jgi:hypothetical protein